MYQGMVFTAKHVMYQVRVCFRDLLVCRHFPVLSASVPYQPVHLTWVGQGPPVMWVQSRYIFYNQTCDLSGQSLISWPTCMLAFSSSHVSRSRLTCHVIQWATIPVLSAVPGYVVYHQIRDVSGQRVCFRGLLVCWHFPALTWVDQAPLQCVL